MKKSMTLQLTFICLVLASNIWASADAPLTEAAGNEKLRSIVEQAKIERFLADLCPYPFILRVLRFVAPFHDETLKTLMELKIISEPYIQLLDSLEKTAEANNNLLVTILSSDKKLKLDLSTAAHGDNDNKSITVSFNDFKSKNT